MYDFLYEATGERGQIENSAIHMYSHLMKCYSHCNHQNGNKISTKWISTIFTQYENLISAKKKKPSAFNTLLTDSNAWEKIKKKAIDEYLNDGNIDHNNNPDDVLGKVLCVFPTLYDLLDKEKIKKYIMNIAISIKDDTAIEDLNKR